MSVDNSVLLLGDCLELMKDIPDNSIDLILTDPPYGTTACKWDSIIPMELMWTEIKRIRKDNAAVCLFGSEPFSSALRMSNIKEFKYDWIWQKARPSNFALAKYQPMKEHEIISLFYKHKYFPIKEERKGSGKSRIMGKYSIGKASETMSIKQTFTTTQGQELRYPSSIQAFNNVESGPRFHPTKKPVDLLEYLIKTYTVEGDTILDFTMGSGSTGVAAINTNRQFIGIEKDQTYFDIATKRIQNVGT